MSPTTQDAKAIVVVHPVVCLNSISHVADYLFTSRAYVTHQYAPRTSSRQARLLNARAVCISLLNPQQLIPQNLA
jgi:hypothetical protein